MARDGDQRLASMTLLAAQMDFSEPGELSFFISPSQLAMLEAVMHKAGVLSSDKMGAAFGLLRSNDLLWAPAINTYVKGKREKLNDLMAWNSDGTRMPWRMHSEYLQQLYLQNDLANGRFKVNGEPIDLKSITLPMVVFGTETDHVAPWKSTYKARGLTRSERLHLCPDERRTQRRHRLRSGASATPFSRADLEGCDHDLRRRRSGSTRPPCIKAHGGHGGSNGSRPIPDRKMRRRRRVGNPARGYDVLGDAPGEYVLRR